MAVVAAVVIHVKAIVRLHFQWCVGKCRACAVFTKSGADPMSLKFDFICLSQIFEDNFKFLILAICVGDKSCRGK